MRERVRVGESEREREREGEGRRHRGREREKGTAGGWVLVAIRGQGSKSPKSDMASPRITPRITLYYRAVSSIRIGSFLP